MNVATKLLIGVALLVAVSAAAAPDSILIDDFENGLSPAWTPKIFEGTTRYSVVEVGQGHALKAESQASASGLVRKVSYDPAEYPVLSWRWKIDRTIAKGDEHTKSGDDYAARIYVVFPHWFFLKTRSLNYIWANHLPENDIIANAYTGNAMMIAASSGPAKAGRWVKVRRNIVDDFRRAFGEDPPAVGAIAVMTDTDNTGETTTGWYDDIRVSRAGAK